MFGVLHLSLTMNIMELEKSHVWRYPALKLNSAYMIFGGKGNEEATSVNKCTIRPWLDKEGNDKKRKNLRHWKSKRGQRANDMEELTPFLGNFGHNSILELSLLGVKPCPVMSNS